MTPSEEEEMVIGGIHDVRVHTCLPGNLWLTVVQRPAYGADDLAWSGEMMPAEARGPRGGEVRPETDAHFWAWERVFPYWNPHGMALWFVLNKEGYIRRRLHLEALSILVGRVQ